MKNIKNSILPAIRVSKEDKELIYKAALKDYRSISSFILTCTLKAAKDKLK